MHAYTHLGWSKVLQYFGNVRHNSAAPFTFCQGREGNEPYLAVRFRAHLILSDCYSGEFRL